jgi:large subunit ribosomal protein L18
VIDDGTGATLVAASTQTSNLKSASDGKKKTELATLVGQAIAEGCKEKKIESVVFDRNGYIYHGRVKAVADGAREGGLTF